MIGYLENVEGKVVLGMDGIIDEVWQVLKTRVSKSEFKDKCALVTLGNPAVCNILEFPDGKIMMPYLKELLDFEWKDLISILGHGKLKSIFDDPDIVSLGYWSNMPAFNELASNIYENYFTDCHPKRIFFDFANIKKRSVEALIETFDVLGALVR